LSLMPLSKFYNGFKDQAPEVAQAEAFKMGQVLGLEAAHKLRLKGNDVNTIAKVVNEIFAEMKSPIPVTVEGDKAVVRGAYICPIMTSAASLKIPWDWLDENFAWPWMRGIASAVNPKVQFTVKRARCYGDSICEHIFEIK
jgi:hypothetical protein